MGTGRDRRSPCLIGVAHHTWHADDVGDLGAPEPLEMWELVARQAGEDAGTPEIFSELERLDVVYSQSWQYDNPVARLSERLGATPATGIYSGIGGSVPQTLLNGAATSILQGELDVAMVVGAEALATIRRLKKNDQRPNWSYPPAEKQPFPMDIPYHPAEISHSIFQAYLTFALFDNARRAHQQHSTTEYATELGELMAPMSEIAATNPDAWFPTARTPSEISQPSASNRMVAFPYTKLMTAIMDVDMAAALILVSDEKADRLGVPQEKRVYLRSWASAADPFYVGERRDLWRSPAMKAVTSSVLAQGGNSIDDVAHFDFYSCFASSLGFALDAAGLDQKEFSSPLRSRSLSVTGGLPYHGGPGSNYMTHSLATMAQRLRNDPDSLGYVSGVGMHMTKHVGALWSATPGPVSPPNLPAIQDKTAQDLEVVTLRESFTGSAQVATYSILHGREGTPEWGALVCDLADGSRCYARLEDPDSLVFAEDNELIGTTVLLSPDETGVTHASLVS